MRDKGLVCIHIAWNYLDIMEYTHIGIFIFKSS